MSLVSRSIVAVLALGALAGPASAQAVDGANVVNTLCNVCHADPSTAPPLKGVYGRPIASIADYGYSDALKAHNKDTWTDANLDAMLTDASGFAQGTWMDFKEPDPKIRSAVIAYLKTLK